MVRKVNHSNTKCCRCGSRETYIYQGSPKWSTHKCSKKDCTGYICWNCNYHVDKSKSKEYFLNKRKKKKCCLCGSGDTYIRSDGSPDWRKYPDTIRWNGRSYMCKKCYMDIQNNLPDSYKNIKKSLSNIRNDELSIYSGTGKGIIGEIIIAAVRKLDVLSIKYDNLCLVHDLSLDLEYGIIQVKTRTLTNDKWFFSYVDDNMNFDNTFAVCIDENLKNIEMVCIIPKENIIEHGLGVIITNNPSHSRMRWYDKFVIDGKLYNEAFHSFMLFLGGKEFFGIEDIKKWFVSVKI